MKGRLEAGGASSPLSPCHLSCHQGAALMYPFWLLCSWKGWQGAVGAEGGGGHPAQSGGRHRGPWSWPRCWGRLGEGRWGPSPTKLTPDTGVCSPLSTPSFNSPWAVGPSQAPGVGNSRKAPQGVEMVWAISQCFRPSPLSPKRLGDWRHVPHVPVLMKPSGRTDVGNHNKPSNTNTVI